MFQSLKERGPGNTNRYSPLSYGFGLAVEFNLSEFAHLSLHVVVVVLWHADGWLSTGVAYRFVTIWVVGRVTL